MKTYTRTFTEAELQWFMNHIADMPFKSAVPLKNFIEQGLREVTPNVTGIKAVADPDRSDDVITGTDHS